MTTLQNKSILFLFSRNLTLVCPTNSIELETYQIIPRLKRLTSIQWKLSKLTLNCQKNNSLQTFHPLKPSPDAIMNYCQKRCCEIWPAAVAVAISSHPIFNTVGQGTGGVNINGCPQGVTTTAPAGATTTAVVWTEPTATDNFGQTITNIQRSHAPGSQFIVGQSTQVTYTFTSNTGGQAQCTFTVTVNGKSHRILAPSYHSQFTLGEHSTLIPMVICPISLPL